MRGTPPPKHRLDRRDLREIAVLIVVIGIAWTGLSLQLGTSALVAAVGAAVIVLGVPLAYLASSGSGRRARERQLQQWIRDRHIPDDVPEQRWRPALERSRESLWVAWPWTLIAALQIAHAVTSLGDLDTHEDQGDVLLAVFWVALATWMLIRWFRLRPILRTLIDDTSRRFWQREHERNANPQTAHEL